MVLLTMKNKASRTAIVQKSGTNGFYNTGIAYWSDSCDSAAKGFKALGFQVKGYNSQEKNWCKKVGVAKETPVRGSVQSVRAALRYLGVPEPKNVDIPNELMEFAGRKVWHSTVGEVQKKAAAKVFVKPLDFQKDFTGHTVYDGWSSILKTLPKNYRLLCQEVVHLTEEFRCYIVEGKIVGIRSVEDPSPPLTFSELSLLEAMLKAYKSQPAGFCLDVARKVTGYSKQLVIVETNEGFSCGNYGIDHAKFAQMIKARWDELVCR